MKKKVWKYILLAFLLLLQVLPMVAQSVASHSVLSQGRWAKIRVNESGIHRLTDQVVRQAGFSDLSKVKIYGYGGNLQNEALSASYLASTDDLQEVPQCVVDGAHFFYAKGPVSWSDNAATQRIRNPYSSYGYYFITQADESPTTLDSTAFFSSCYPQPEDYHFLYENDGFSWYEGGRNLFDPTEVAVGSTQRIVISNPANCAKGTLSVALTSGGTSEVEILKNGTSLGTVNLSLGGLMEDVSYVKASEKTKNFAISDFSTADTVVIRPKSGVSIHLDYVSVAWEKPGPRPQLDANIPEAQYVYSITPQDHHADAAADMVIIIPTSQKLLAQAKRLKEFHETHDGLRVSIVPADELYNEFSSGTPDANAYRRYLRMLSDRASSEADKPKYLLLFGDCVWDNRMLTSTCKTLDADDYLLAYESENSFSAVSCYVSDSWLGILGEGAGLYPARELQDVAVGRFPVTTAAEAKIMVDKVISYATNANAGVWQNSLVFMGDDGNSNEHMAHADEVAEEIDSLYPGYLVKKVMWDAYTRETSSTGNTYPEVTKVIKGLQKNGALVMNYSGHGSANQLSHESVLTVSDFEQFKNANLPLWVTASCDVMPFDGTSTTIGETAVLNENGGAVAFYGTTRTVYAQQNRHINHAFMRRVLSRVNGKPVTIGEAHRLAQNDVMTGRIDASEQDVTVNHLQYSLLGDPALALNLPNRQVVIDSINGISTADGNEKAVLKAGSVARMVGHIVGEDNFRGVVTAQVRDSKEEITCKLNDTSGDGADEAFVYEDRPNTIYLGTDSVVNGKFAFSFAVPMDINYTLGTGLANLYAVSNDKTLCAQGYSEQFVVGGTEDADNDSIGPSVHCYLNYATFQYGGSVNTTPYFVAEITDKDGINATGSGIGHDLQLVIDGDMDKTYVLNDYFTYDFGTYTSGTARFSIPELDSGEHQLTFRAWDTRNNSSTTTLHFNVVSGLSPNLFQVGVTENPAKNSTTFVITHDRTETNIDVAIEVYDMAGRMVWHHSEKGVPDTDSYQVKWDLSSTGGQSLRSGIYLYRVKVASDGSSYTSKVNKLIISK